MLDRLIDDYYSSIDINQKILKEEQEKERWKHIFTDLQLQHETLRLHYLTLQSDCQHLQRKCDSQAKEIQRLAQYPHTIIGGLLTRSQETNSASNNSNNNSNNNNNNHTILTDELEVNEGDKDNHDNNDNNNNANNDDNVTAVDMMTSSVSFTVGDIVTATMHPTNGGAGNSNNNNNTNNSSNNTSVNTVNSNGPMIHRNNNNSHLSSCWSHHDDPFHSRSHVQPHHTHSYYANLLTPNYSTPTSLTSHSSHTALTPTPTATATATATTTDDCSNHQQKKRGLVSSNAMVSNKKQSNDMKEGAAEKEEEYAADFDDCTCNFMLFRF
jgi:hypothetical protein